MITKAIERKVKVHFESNLLPVTVNEVPLIIQTMSVEALGQLVNKCVYT